jgi:hypothetical protein
MVYKMLSFFFRLSQISETIRAKISTAGFKIDIPTSGGKLPVEAKLLSGRLNKPLKSLPIQPEIIADQCYNTML